MPLLLLLVFPIAEIYAFTVFVQKYGFLEGLATLFISGFLGIFVMKSVGRAIVTDFQTNLSRGRLPTSQVIHRTVVVVGGLLLMIPGLVSDVLGLICIMPGTRHLIVLYVKFMFAKGLFKASRGFSFVFNGKKFEGFQNAGPDFRAGSTHERDATVIDVTPIEISHSKKDS
jgi:UPF0716 family protein affecting phage T7 exclusion